MYNGSATVTIGSYLASGQDQSVIIASPTGGDTTGCGEIAPSGSSYLCYDTGGGALTIVGEPG